MKTPVVENKIVRPCCRYSNEIVGAALVAAFDMVDPITMRAGINPAPTKQQALSEIIWEIKSLSTYGSGNIMN
jgi:hypothetical protein